MGIKQEPFKRYNEEKVADSFTVRLNAEQRLELDNAKKILQQAKDSTALKQLAAIGAKVLQEEKILEILGVVMNNYRKNKRLGIVDFD
jgi:hypothetical protein